jgi:hypothetical protein
VRIGDDTLDWETLHRLSTSDDRDERPIITLDWLEPLVSLGPTDTVANSPDAQAFFALVNKALAATDNKELVIYVHGSNNTMPRAAAPGGAAAPLHGPAHRGSRVRVALCGGRC